MQLIERTDDLTIGDNTAEVRGTIENAGQMNLTICDNTRRKVLGTIGNTDEYGNSQVVTPSTHAPELKHQKMGFTRETQKRYPKFDRYQDSMLDDLSSANYEKRG